MNAIDKTLYIIVAPFIFGTGFIIGFTGGLIKKAIKFWKESTK